MYSILGHTDLEDLVMEARILCTVSSDTLLLRTCNGGAHPMYSILGYTALEDLVMEARILCTVSSDTLPSPKYPWSN